jgi:hypothetical protein
MLGAYSLIKVIESELQAYMSATKGRVVHMLVVFALFFHCFSLSLSVSFSIVTHVLCFNNAHVWACRNTRISILVLYQDSFCCAGCHDMIRNVSERSD